MYLENLSKRWDRNKTVQWSGVGSWSWWNGIQLTITNYPMAICRETDKLELVSAVNIQEINLKGIPWLFHGNLYHYPIEVD